MDAAQEGALPTPALVTVRDRDQGPRDPSLRAAWALFLALGLPSLLMAALTSLAAARIYFEPLRALWMPWPPEVLKPFLGLAGFATTLGYLAYRIGRSRGYYSGQLAGLAAARNLAEGWKPPFEREAGPPTPAPPENPPPPADTSAAPTEMPPPPSA